MKYTSNKELAQLYRTWRADDAVPERLVEVIELMGDGIRARYYHYLDWWAWEEIMQEVWVRVLRTKDMVKLTGNIFGYLTSLIMATKANLYRDAAVDGRRMAYCSHRQLEVIAKDAK